MLKSLRLATRAILGVGIMGIAISSWAKPGPEEIQRYHPRVFRTGSRIQAEFCLFKLSGDFNGKPVAGTGVLGSTIPASPGLLDFFQAGEVAEDIKFVFSLPGGGSEPYEFYLDFNQVDAGQKSFVLSPHDLAKLSGSQRDRLGMGPLDSLSTRLVSAHNVEQGETLTLELWKTFPARPGKGGSPVQPATRLGSFSLRASPAGGWEYDVRKGSPENCYPYDNERG